MRQIFRRFGCTLCCLSGLLFAGCAEVVTEGGASGPVVEIDGESVRHGMWVETYEDGTRKSHGRFTRGIPTGLHRTWHPNGQPAAERRYDWEGRLHEKQVDFDENGARISKTFYAHGEEVIEDEDEDGDGEEGGKAVEKDDAQ